MKDLFKSLGSIQRKPLLRIVSLLTFSFCVIFPLRAQVKVVTYKNITSNQINVLNWFNEPASNFCFPQQDTCKAISIPGKVLNKSKNEEYLLEYFDWQVTNGVYGLTSKVLNVGVRYTENGRISFEYFIENVDRIIVILYCTNGMALGKEFKPDFENGFQLLTHTYLAQFESADSRPVPTSFEINQVKVLFKPRTNTKTSRFYMGSFFLEEFNSHAPGKLFPWLDSLIGNFGTSSEMLDNYSKWSMQRLRQFSEVPSFERFASEQGYLSGLVQINLDSSVSELLVLEKIMSKTFDMYPFYKEREIDKARALESANQIFCADTKINYQQRLDQLKNLIDGNFKDPHFSLFIPESLNISKNINSKRNPIAFKKIANQTIVAAVFNEGTAKTIPLGSRVISMNGKSVDLLSESELNAASQKQVDTLCLVIENKSSSSGVTSISIPYSVSITLPSGFKPIHGESFFFADSVFYLRFNNWSGDNYYRLLNNRHNIIKSQGLVIDLRGNGGGFGSDVYRSLSLFFEESQAVGSLNFPWVKETVVVFPDRQIFRIPSSKRVAIIVDSNTACASEMFLMGLKDRKNTYVIGDSFTKGAIASPILYEFPSGLKLRAHSTIRRFWFDEQNFKEGRGIEPDIWVSKTHARDLRPYEDKVLKTACAILKRN